MKKINAFILCLLLVILNGCTNDSKPNIIWITIEDQSQYLLPFNGNQDISLPNLEKIAKEGLIFEIKDLPFFELKNRLLVSFSVGWIVSCLGFLYALYEIRRTGNWPFSLFHLNKFRTNSLLTLHSIVN